MRLYPFNNIYIHAGISHSHCAETWVFVCGDRDHVLSLAAQKAPRKAVKRIKSIFSGAHWTLPTRVNNSEFPEPGGGGRAERMVPCEFFSRSTHELGSQPRTSTWVVNQISRIHLQALVF